MNHLLADMFVLKHFIFFTYITYVHDALAIPQHMSELPNCPCSDLFNVLHEVDCSSFILFILNEGRL